MRSKIRSESVGIFDRSEVTEDIGSASWVIWRCYESTVHSEGTIQSKLKTNSETSEIVAVQATRPLIRSRSLAYHLPDFRFRKQKVWTCRSSGWFHLSTPNVHDLLIWNCTISLDRRKAQLPISSPPEFINMLFRDFGWINQALDTSFSHIPYGNKTCISDGVVHRLISHPNVNHKFWGKKREGS